MVYHGVNKNIKQHKIDNNTFLEHSASSNTLHFNIHSHRKQLFKIVIIFHNIIVFNYFTEHCYRNIRNGKRLIRIQTDVPFRYSDQSETSAGVPHEGEAVRRLLVFRQEIPVAHQSAAAGQRCRLGPSE